LLDSFKIFIASPCANFDEMDVIFTTAFSPVIACLTKTTCPL
jgi:hypothetical protein